MTTSKQRIMNAMNHKMSDRFPMDIWAAQPIVSQLEQHFGITGFNEVKKAIGTDVFSVGPRNPFVPNPPDANDVVYDEWGVGRRLVKNRYDQHPDLVDSPMSRFDHAAEVDRYPWPSPDDLDYSGIATQCEEYSDYALKGGFGHFFCPGADLRGYETWLIDIIEESSVGFAIMEHMTEYWEEYTSRVVEASHGRLDILNLADDYSSQLGLMISPESFRRFFRPYLKRIIDIGKRHGLKVFFHSCGAVRKLIPELIDLGVDILNPIQIRAEGMSPEELIEEYGRDLCFHGGVDLQRTLPFGTTADVRNEVIRLMNTLGKYGGYIVAPSHSIQPDTPLENVLEIFKTVLEYSDSRI